MNESFPFCVLLWSKQDWKSRRMIWLAQNVAPLLLSRIQQLINYIICQTIIIKYQWNFTLLNVILLGPMCLYKNVEKKGYWKGSIDAATYWPVPGHYILPKWFFPSVFEQLFGVLVYSPISTSLNIREQNGLWISRPHEVIIYHPGREKRTTHDSS